MVVATFPAAPTVRQFDPEVPNAVIAKLVVVALIVERFPGKFTVWPILPIVIPVAVDVPIEIVLDESTTTLESPEMFVPLNVSVANAGRAVRARTPSTIPALRGQWLRLSSDDFILEKGLVRRLFK